MSDGTSHIDHKDHMDIDLGYKKVVDYHIGVSRLQLKGNIDAIAILQLKFHIDFKLKLNRLLQKIATLEPGENVLIYCEVGKHRSSFLAAAVVMASARCSVNDALEFIKLMRPCVEFSRSKNDDHFCGRQALILCRDTIWANGTKVFTQAVELPRCVTEEQWREAFTQERRQPQD
jgi:hypothetical protein